MTVTWLYPTLEALNDGRVLRRATAVALTVMAWAVVAGGAIGVVGILRLSLTAAVPLAVSVGGIAWTIVFAVVVHAMHQVFRYHVRDVEALADARFVAIPLAAIVVRVAGEQFALWSLGFGAGGFVLMLVAGPYASMLASAVDVVPGMPSMTATGLLGAIWFLGACAVIGGIGLGAAYLAAEGFEAVADIANQLRALAGGSATRTTLPVAQVVDTDRTVVLGPGRTCAVCGTQTTTLGATFCDGCGGRL